MNRFDKGGNGRKPAKKKSFKELLDDKYKWPTTYTFKFIVKPSQLEEITKLLNTTQVTTRTSKNGKYISVTAKMMMSSSDDVINIYKKAGLIKGIIAL